MNSINSVCTTVSQGKVYVTVNNKYIGNVDSYNNCFTKFFAWLFGSSISVDFDGKVRSINKKSYIDLLKTLEVDAQKINKISSYSIFRSIAQGAHLPETGLKMRQVIAGTDQIGLLQKLAIAISKQDTAKALLMINKGAALDTTYYHRNQPGLSPAFCADNDDLDTSRAYKFTVFRGTPLLQAALKNQHAVCKHLKDMGADLSSIAEQYTFKREIISVENQPFVTSQRYEVEHCVLKDGRTKKYTTHHTRPAVEMRPVVTTQDSRVSTERFKIDETTGNWNLIPA